MQEWAAFERVSGPILLHERIEVSNAFVAMTVASAAGGERLKLQDFIPIWDEAEEPDNSEQIVAALKELERRTKEGRYGGRDVHPEPPS